MLLILFIVLLWLVIIFQTILIIRVKNKKIAKRKYDGVILLTQKTDGSQLASLEFPEEPEDLIHKEDMLFKVVTRIV